MTYWRSRVVTKWFILLVRAIRAGCKVTFTLAGGHNTRACSLDYTAQHQKNTAQEHGSSISLASLVTQSLAEGSNPEVEKCFWGVERGRCVRLTALPPSVSRLSSQIGILNIQQPHRLPPAVTGTALVVIKLFCLQAVMIRWDLRNDHTDHFYKNCTFHVLCNVRPPHSYTACSAHTSNAWAFHTSVPSQDAFRTRITVEHSVLIEVSYLKLWGKVLFPRSSIFENNKKAIFWRKYSHLFT
jgi:hypothetical protein